MQGILNEGFLSGVVTVIVTLAALARALPRSLGPNRQDGGRIRACLSFNVL